MEGTPHPVPRTVEEVFSDFKGRRAGLIKALTTGSLPLSLLLPHHISLKKDMHVTAVIPCRLIFFRVVNVLVLIGFSCLDSRRCGEVLPAVRPCGFLAPVFLERVQGKLDSPSLCNKNLLFSDAIISILHVNWEHHLFWQRL
ncbi:hypothetical protein SAY86_027525 [Trapa natans]|uniref:Uncharacterized protein n=1 Tax=Trapa natans TaxID=22666 RepID=A0AAN7KT70_TRANT|nr:hypothetical protein SAY86_027525 [Trapa natans]